MVDFGFIGSLAALPVAQANAFGVGAVYEASLPILNELNAHPGLRGPVHETMQQFAAGRKEGASLAAGPSHALPGYGEPTRSSSVKAYGRPRPLGFNGPN
ncbi:MAG: hypothetical protein M3N08_04680 [Pseudomonadota bacterium]|nr:hypothetical protein [Pseudomonadota bacterium]